MNTRRFFDFRFLTTKSAASATHCCGLLVGLLFFSCCQPASPVQNVEAAWLSLVDTWAEKDTRVAAFWTMTDLYNGTNKDSTQLLLERLEAFDDTPEDVLMQAFFCFQSIKYAERATRTFPKDTILRQAHWLIDHYKDYQVPDILAVAQLYLLTDYEKQARYADAALFIKAQQENWLLFSLPLQCELREKAAMLFIEDDNFTQALLQLKQALYLADEYQSPYYTGSIHFHIGDIFNRLSLPDLAVASHKVALASFISVPKDQQAEDINNYIRELQILTATSTEEAVSYYEAGKKETEKVQPQEHPECLEFCLMTHYFRRKDYANAELFLRKVIAQKEAKHELVSAHADRTKLMGFLNQKGQFTATIALGQQIAPSLIEADAKQALRRLYTQLRRAYDGLHQLDSAYHYLRLYEQVKNPLSSNSEVSIQLIQLVDEFNQAKTKDLQERSRLKIEHQLKVQKVFLWASALVLVLISCLSVLLWKNFKIKKRTNILLKQQKTSLEQNNQRLERFALGISHDILSDLNLILTTGYVLVDHAEEKSNGYIRFYEQTMTVVKNAKLYCQELLRSAKQDEPKDLTTDASEIINDILEQQQPLLQQYNIRTRTDISVRQIPMSTGDLAQVLKNLLDNSIRYLIDIPNAEIVFTTSTRQDQVVIGVLDNGPGVDEALLETIFSAQYSEQGPLHGTGLAMVRSIVASYGGKVWAERRAAGGLGVWFTLNRS